MNLITVNNEECKKRPHCAHIEVRAGDVVYCQCDNAYCYIREPAHEHVEPDKKIKEEAGNNGT